MKSLLAIVCCAVALAACDITKGGSPTMPTIAPVADAGGGIPLTAQDLDYFVGSWSTPRTNPTRGEAGALTVVFGPTVPPNLSTTLTWVSAQTSLEYHGTSTGTLDQDGRTMHVTIQADAANPIGASTCGYTADAQMSADHNHLLVTYAGNGPGVCSSKAGTADLVRQGNPPTCTGGGTLIFLPSDPGGNRLAVYPDPLIRAPQPDDFPGALPLRAFDIPAGTWDFTVGTIDPGHVNWATEDPDDEQTQERLTVPLYEAIFGSLLHTLGPTDDVPQRVSTLVVSTFRDVVLPRPVGLLKVIHAWLGRPVSKPLHSVEIQFVTYACPAGVVR